MADAAARLREAIALAREGRLAEAEAAYRGVLALQPNHPDALYGLGVMLRDLGRPAEAEAAFRAAVAARPTHPESLNNLGVVLMKQGRAGEAVEFFSRALRARPDHVRAVNNLGAALLELDDLDGAADSFRRATALDPGHAKAHNNLGVVLQQQGDLDAAAAAFGRAVAADPAYAEGRANLAGLATAGEAAEVQAGQIETLALATRDPEARAVLLFALGRLHEQAGRFDQAFDAWTEANALRRANLEFDIGAAEARLAVVAQAFDASLMRRLGGGGAPDRRPIFVIGMPRSGTTLIEQILASHPQVQGGGELPAMGQAIAAFDPATPFPLWARDLSPEARARLGRAYLEALPPAQRGRMRLTDKAVSNVETVGLIHLVLPQAIIVRVRRDPRDAALSCFATRFTEGQGFAYDLEELGRYWRACDRLMDHWRAVLPPGRMLEVDYETVVADLEGQARRLLDHCGLPWDPACLDFHRAERPVRTASAVQVRRPIHAGSVGRWRRFEGRLGPLIEALGR